MAVQISFDRAQLEQFCRRHHIARLSLFGSVLRDDFKPESDVDVLVEFQPGQKLGFIRLCQIEDELSKLFGGHKLDVVTPKFLNHRIRDQVLAQAQVQYDQG